MRVALVHELLTMRGGAERNLRVLAAMFPESPIYTLLYDEKKLGDWFPKKRVRAAKAPLLMRLSPLKFNHHLFLPFFPRMVEQWDFSEYDLVISSSSAFVHGIVTTGKTRHLCYVNAPARYLWDRAHEVRERASRGLLGPIRKRLLSLLFHRLRLWDVESATRPHAILVSSEEVHRRVELYWRRESTVVYPPLDDFWLQESRQPMSDASSCFLVVSTLVPYKRIDLAIEACNALKLSLKIVGEGPAMASLKKIAGPSIEFLGYKSQEELRDLYADAAATIVPGEEDFCLVALESMACGTPVIALGKGGVRETVIEGETGEFFEDANVESLLETLKIFDQKKYSEETCIARAKEFSREKFEEGIQKAIGKIMRP